MRRVAALLALGLLVSAVGVAPAGAALRADKSPVARADRMTIPEDARFTYTAPGVLSNDKDPEGRKLRTRMVRPPKHGTASINARGALRYKPDRNWSGTDSLVYVATDPAGNTDRAKVRLTVYPVNDAARLGMTSATEITEGGTGTITLTAHDPENGPLTYFYDCDDVGVGDGRFEIGPVPASSYDCFYPDDRSLTVSGRVVDDQGARSTLSLGIVVRNVAPLVLAGGDQDAVADVPQTLDLDRFTDPGTDGPWTVSVDWGDGTTDDTFQVAWPGDFADLQHTWAGTGEPLEVYTVTVTVTEDGGVASGTDTFSVDVTD